MPNPPPDPRHGLTLWFTGLPCAGKTTLSTAVAEFLRKIGYPVEHLDGDTIRKKFGGDLGFSKHDREVHVARAAFAASRLSQNGTIALVSVISPYREMRENARRVIGSFVEIYVRCPLEICERRDLKGMYRLAREGRIPHFTGVSDPYEEPLSPEITVDTHLADIRSCTQKILDYLETRKLLIHSENL